MRGQAGVPAFGLGAHRVEVHEPRLEERPRDRLQRLAHAPVQLDLVVQRAEDVCDGALFGQRWDAQPEVRYVSALQAVEDGPNVKKLANLLPPLRPSKKPAKERRGHPRAISAQQDEVLAKCEL